MLRIGEGQRQAAGIGGSGRGRLNGKGDIAADSKKQHS